MIEVFGARKELRQSTSPVPGKVCVAVVEHDGRAWPDLFLWDPISDIVQWDHARVEEFLRATKRRQSPLANAVLWTTEGMITLVRGIRGLFGGSYGGSLGFGQLGGLVAMMSAVLAIVAFLAAAVVLVPLTLIAWGLRAWIDQQVKKEAPKVVDQVQVFCRSLPAADSARRT